jgi:hypothetical protein
MNLYSIDEKVDELFGKIGTPKRDAMEAQLKEEVNAYFVDKAKKKIVALCQKHKVNKLFVFGSVLTPRFNDNSDIDLVVDFKRNDVEDYFNNFFDFKYSLEELFGRDVDLLEEQTIRNPYLKKSVDATKTLIYG